MTRIDALTARALGLSGDGLSSVSQIGLADPKAADALERLMRRAQQQGFDIRVASGYRDYRRQLSIFNAKACGDRPVHDDNGVVLERSTSSDDEWLHAILRFSALPGTSRHHWGTDFDLWDAAAVPDDYRLRLEPAEYSEHGVFAEFNAWLGECIARDDAEGFYRPYDQDRGGVAVEPWHVSYRRSAQPLSERLSLPWLLKLWRKDSAVDDWQIPTPLALLGCVEPQADALLQRYVWNCAE